MISAERVDDWCERGILGLMLAVLAFGPLATGAVRAVDFLVIHGLVMAAAGLWLVRIWLNPGYRLLWPPMTWGVLAFVVYAGVRTYQAELEYVARQEFVRVLVYALVFLVVVNNLHRQASVQWVSWVMVFLGMLIAGYAIYQFATGSTQVWHFIKPAQYVGRGSGTYICPNHLAGLLEMLIPLGLAFAVLGREYHVLRLCLGYAAAVMVVGVIVSLSRGGWIATALSLCAFALVLLRKRAQRIPLLVAVLVISTTAYLFANRSELVQQRVERALAVGQEGHIRSRAWLAVPTTRMWLDHFWFGAGPAHFDYRFPAYRPEELQARPGRAHNDYLNTLADWGTVGGLLVFGTLGALAWGTWRSWRYVGREEGGLGARQSNRSAFVLGASVGLLALAIHSLADFNMHIPANAILAVTLMGLLATHLRYTSNRYWLRMGWLPKLLMTLLLMTVLSYLGQQLWLRAGETYWLVRAGPAKRITPERVEALQRAAAIEPTNFETTYALGEAQRLMSWEGTTGYRRHAQMAIEWYERGIELNPYEAYNHVRLGMCLDWLGEHERAAPYYEEAIRRDPNNHYIANLVGWHHVQTGEWAQAKQWFERSIAVKWWANWIAYRYLGIVNRQLAQEPAAAAGQPASNDAP
jgi:O-antigen ligase